MKSCATGLSVRFFRLIIPTGARVLQLHGKTAIFGLLEPAPGLQRKKASVATRLSRVREDRYARMVETAGAETSR